MAGAMETTAADKFGIGFYFQTLTRMLGMPKIFFSELPEPSGIRRPFYFLLSSALFFAGASLTCIGHGQMLLIGLILLLNAVVMPFVSAGACYLIITMTIRKRATFSMLFSVHAYAAGVTMLASWIPLFMWLTEPWKWCLIILGMVKACRLSWPQAVLTAVGSVVVIILFFLSLSPVIFWLKGI